MFSSTTILQVILNVEYWQSVDCTLRWVYSTLIKCKGAGMRWEPFHNEVKLYKWVKVYQGLTHMLESILIIKTLMSLVVNLGKSKDFEIGT